MSNVYFKPSATLRWVCLFSLLLGAAPESPAQQKAPRVALPKMALHDPLRKIGTELAALQTERAVGPSTARAQMVPKTSAKRHQLIVRGDYVVIEAVAEPNQTAQLLTELTALGMIRPATYGRMVSGLMPIRALDKAATVKSLRFARPAYQPHRSVGEVTSQGDKAMYADVARKEQVITGQGSKIGVLSDSYNSLDGAEKGIKSGDLPGPGNPKGFTKPVQVLEDLPDGTDEGRAMLEIIHDVAPGAQLAFHTAFLGQAGFAQGILDLQKAGCNVITDDIIYFAEPMFQDGIIAQAVDAAQKKGASYFSSAGNSGNDSYQARYQSGGPASFGSQSIFGGYTAHNAHNFAPANQKPDVTQEVYVPVGGSIILSFQYSQPFYSVGDDASNQGSASDFDIYLLNQDTTNIVASSIEENLGGDPVELLVFFNDGSYGSNTFNILIDNYAGGKRELLKYVAFTTGTEAEDVEIKEHNTHSSTIYGHANAAGAVATGAVFFLDTPAYGTPTPVAEEFSSVGGTPILFDQNGQSQTQEVRRKPEIMGPDGVNTSFFGNQFLDEFYFFGTSAAAPHAAAVAALMQEANGNQLSPRQILQNLQETALDMNTAGFDYETGYGFLDASKAVAAGAKPRVRYFALINARTGRQIQTLQEGEVVNLTRLPTRQLLIRAVTGPAAVGSVVLQLNNTQKTENQAPYDYPGTSDARTLPAGDYTVTATPYTQSRGRGEKGRPLTVQFKAVEEKIVRFELIDVAENKVIKTLETGDILYLPDLPAKLNIRAVTSAARVGSVQFNLNDQITTENEEPYEVAGSSGGSIDLATGLYALSAGTYRYAGAGGLPGDTKTIFFAAVDVTAEQAALANKLKGKISIFPNPVTERARVQFTVPETGTATLTLYDLNGAPVKILHQGTVEAGKPYEYTLDGNSLRPGWYIGRLVTSKGTFHQKLRVVR